MYAERVLEEIFGIFSQDTGVSKSNQLHVDIFQIFFINLRYNSIDSYKMISSFPKFLNFKPVILKLNRFIGK